MILDVIYSWFLMTPAPEPEEELLPEYNARLLKEIREEDT